MTSGVYSPQSDLFGHGLRTEARALEGVSRTSPGPATGFRRPPLSTTLDPVPRVAAEVRLVLLYQMMCDELERFCANYLPVFSDCATLRKAIPADCEHPVYAVRHSSIAWVSDLKICGFCGLETREWLVATFGNRDCVCRSCYPKWSKGIRKKILSPSVATVGDVGETAARPIIPHDTLRHYFLYP